jgi:hypothetical protein
METISAIVYFGSVLTALPAFIALEAWALWRFSGWARIVPLIPGLYVGWTLFDEFAPIVLHGQDLESSDFRRLLYERWSAESRTALVASAVVVALLCLRKMKRLRRNPGAR